MFPHRDSRFVKVGLIIFFVLILIYAYFESRAMLYGPKITISSEIVTIYEPYTLIRGQAENITELRINGTIVPVTEEGLFEESYVVSAGQNHVVLDARDKYGRTRQKTIEIIYIPSQDSTKNTTPVATSTEQVAE